MTPVIVVVFLLSVIRIFSSFEIELLLGVPWSFYVYSTKIVDLARQEPPLVNQAAALGSIILVFLAAFIPIQRKLITRRQFTTVTGQFKPKTIDLGAWRYPATVFVALVIFVLDVVPLLSVLGGSFMTRFGFFNLPKTWTLEYWKMALSDPRILQGLHNTLIVAVSAGLVGAVLFSLIGYVLVRTKLPGRAVLDSICWLPSAIPGVLSGLGLLWMFLGTPVFRPFYGTLVLLMVAQMLGGITLSTQILKANLVQLGKELEESSRMSGAGFWRTYLRIVFPLMAQTMVMVGVIKFMFAAQHNSAIILLATSETRTLSLLALDQVAAGYREVAQHHHHYGYATHPWIGYRREVVRPQGRHPGGVTMRRIKRKSRRRIEDGRSKIAILYLRSSIIICNCIALRSLPRTERVSFLRIQNLYKTFDRVVAVNHINLEASRRRVLHVARFQRLRQDDDFKWSGARETRWRRDSSGGQMSCIRKQASLH